MRKIISLFKRDYEGNRQVVDEIVPGAEWVIAGEGQATRKWDGSACLIKDGLLYKRYDAKKGKTPPEGFIPAQSEPDEVTGHFPGWLLVGDGPEDKWHLEALKNTGHSPVWALPDWTYEACGPHFQSNREGLDVDMLLPHGKEIINAPRTFDELRVFFALNDIEGVVWWRDLNDPDCDKVKIKAKDFGIKRGGKP